MRNKIKANKKTYPTIVLLLGITLLLISSVSAFAVSSKYWEERPIKLPAGGIETFEVILQNQGGSETINVRGEILQGSDIAQIETPQDAYPVPVGARVPLNVTVTIPEDAVINDTYNIELAFTTITDSEGTLGFGLSAGRMFPVLVIEGEKKPSILDSLSSNPVSIAAIIIIAIVIATLIIRKRK